ncbi:vWA domain-containing protein [Falsibacillus albus]|uniref:VWA domain-containing protein n=1 Tax=Falsibacillus albus TaxID=2478915 RepID=A0A3L7JRL6_9BACI|nr:VWA domain-containing protein [Falsibacillus albus]RLQ91152.1 VWA domain-containing protein [Falsibacillus albus]
MKSQLKASITLLLFLLALSGCSGDVKSKGSSAKTQEPPADSQAANSEIQNKEEEFEVAPLPSNYQELAKRPVGEYADKVITFMTKEEYKTDLPSFDSLPDMSGDRSDQELDGDYELLLSKFQKGFKGPEEAVRQLRFQAIGSPEFKDTRYQFKDNLNVEIILDSSGSMAQKVNGVSKMDAAKKTIHEFVKKLPKGAKVGLRVYGNKGSNADSDKEVSCSSSDILYPISTYREEDFQTALGKAQPTGWTPTALALKQANKDMSAFDSSDNTNIVYLVSDGISTCDDDPVKAAKDLYHSNISPIINIIGFDIDSKGQNQLKQMAEAAKGIYKNVSDENELSSELEKLSDLAEKWADWKKRGESSLKVQKLDNTIKIFSYTQNEGLMASQERMNVFLYLNYLQEKKKISDESYQYLKEKNKKYHDWIDNEVKQLQSYLQSLNEKNYGDAMNALEEKFQQNQP